GREGRHGRRETAVLRNETRVPAFVQHADDQEERAGGNSVVDLLDHAAGKPVRGQRKNSQRAESQVADRTVGDQLLHVFLHHADERAVNYADDRQNHHDGDNFVARRGVLRQERQREADESVRPHFQQNAGQDDGNRRGGFGGGGRRPGAE